MMSVLVALYSAGTAVEPKRQLYVNPCANMLPDTTTVVKPETGPLVGLNDEITTGAS